MSAAPSLVFVVATEAEAEAVKSILGDDVIVVAVSSGVRAIQGLRVGAISATSAAIEHPDYQEFNEVLLRSQAMSGYER